MLFEWDKNKNQINKAKHGVSFETAGLIFFDPCCLSTFDRVVNGEERWHSMGQVNGVLILLVVHTTKYDDGKEIILIISARRPTSHERKRYENG